MNISQKRNANKQISNSYCYILEDALLYISIFVIDMTDILLNYVNYVSSKLLDSGVEQGAHLGFQHLLLTWHWGSPKWQLKFKIFTSSLVHINPVWSTPKQKAELHKLAQSNFSTFFKCSKLKRGINLSKFQGIHIMGSAKCLYSTAIL